MKSKARRDMYSRGRNRRDYWQGGRSCGNRTSTTSLKGNIALTKVDEDYPDNKLSGAVFEVYSDTNGDGKLDKDDTLLWRNEGT